MNDKDVDSIIGILDKALLSEDARVKKALQDLLIITALIEGSSDGPLKNMKAAMTTLMDRLSKVEETNRQLSYHVSIMQGRQKSYSYRDEADDAFRRYIDPYAELKEMVHNRTSPNNKSK